MRRLMFDRYVAVLEGTKLGIGDKRRTVILPFPLYDDSEVDKQS